MHFKLSFLASVKRLLALHITICKLQDYARIFLQSTCQIIQESCENHARFYAMTTQDYARIFLQSTCQIIQESCENHARKFYAMTTQDYARIFLQSTCQIIQESCKNHAGFYAMIYPRLCKNILTKYLSDHT